MFRLGLTGGIGSGKSTAAQCLEALGAVVIDADAIAKSATSAGSPAIPEIRRVFGAEAIDATGAMDRAFVREIVFREPSAKSALEAIVHPIVREQSELATASAASAGRWVVQDIPLLVESGHWRSALSAVLVIDCDETTQVARVQARNGWTEAQVRAVISQQASRQHRLSAADHVIYNVGLSREQLAQALKTLVLRLGLPLHGL